MSRPGWLDHRPEFLTDSQAAELLEYAAEIERELGAATVRLVAYDDKRRLEQEAFRAALNRPPGQHDLIWHCRFHPTDWFHEIGCPHITWTKEQLQSSIERQKHNQIRIYEMWHADMEKRYAEVRSSLLTALKLGRAIIADELEVLERSYLPEPSEKEAEELTERRAALETIEAAIAKAEGSQTPTPASEAEQRERQTNKNENDPTEGL